MPLRYLLRALFIAFAAGFALQVYDIVYGPEAWEDESVAFLYAAIAVFVAIGIVFFEARIQRSIVKEIVAVAFGLGAGIVLTVFVVALIVIVVLPAEGTLTAAFARIQIWIPLIMTAICYMSVTIVLQTKGDFRFLVPYIDFSHRGQDEGELVLDTSVLIDGRIVDICNTNIIDRPLVITDYVIRELQALADSSDKLKRDRGRRGLDVVNTLKKTESVHLQILETDIPDKCDVDVQLVMLAKRANGRIVTNDFNLNKVAQIEGVKVVNLNDIANAMKPVVLPGENILVKIVRAGDEEKQGIAYLEDGTMIVVEGGKDHIEKSINITITGSIQTSAGRLVFGKVPGFEGYASANGNGKKQNKNNKKQNS